MPYRTVADLPKAQTDQYNAHQKEAFLKAFNSAYEQYKHDEGRAFAVAHSAARRPGSTRVRAEILVERPIRRYGEYLATFKSAQGMLAP
jgi:cation transport regulator